MKRTAKKENDRARKLWGSFGSHNYGRSFVLPPKAARIQLMLKENKTLKKVTFIPANKNDETHMGHYMFKKEIQFYVGKIKKS